ncbi:unnamed protein product [Eruca vesicaria subsp. sativa]|uniref:Enhanced disease resistance 4-like N-terminal domain-containing protein n=1 Tax=Eruca vesicaria subsp. sativa TaxID=29727 RepID=A0ABC8IZL5_ERUVS|nr:unnamed protein product [Eruca vesicaria subsp. sativa]
MMKKKKQSRSQSSTREPSPDSSPSPRLLSIFRSKLVSGKDLKHMFRGMKTKTAPGLSSQSRIVRCPKCHKLLQEPIDATIYKCSGCNSILQGTIIAFFKSPSLTLLIFTSKQNVGNWKVIVTLFQRLSFILKTVV